MGAMTDKMLKKGEHTTGAVELRRIPTEPPCWRLVLWLPPNDAGVVTIDDVYESSIYGVLRKIAEGRGVRLPTELRVRQAVEALGGWSKVDEGGLDAEFTLKWTSQLGIQAVRNADGVTRTFIVRQRGGWWSDTWAKVPL